MSKLKRLSLLDLKREEQESSFSFHPKSQKQREAIKIFQENDIVFYIGPAGTGKTYLAIALAVQEIVQKRREKIILTRPAVEAGEELGFLPGSKEEKLEPYLQPLYDSADKLLGRSTELRNALMKLVEVVPLAYMRGRTFDNAVCILDEAQNSTISQQKMFLTRIGSNTKMVICGDTDQTDLRGPVALRRVFQKFSGRTRVGNLEFVEEDIVRNPIIRLVLECFRDLER